METKYTIAVLAAGLLVSAAVFRRDLLHLADLGIALGIALVLAAPNIVWEAQHHWETVRFLAGTGPSATSETRPQFLFNLFVIAGAALVPVWIVVFRRLHRDRSTRWLAWAIGLVCLVYFAAGGKSYYAGPMVVVPIAAGALSVERWIRTPRRLAVAAVLVVVLTVPVLPIAVPVLPAATMVNWHVVDDRSDYKDELGWGSIVDGAARAAAIRPAAAVIAANYGEAGALDVLGKGKGLPPTVSGNMSYRYWRPKQLGSRNIVVVGYDKVSLASICTQYRVVTHVQIPYGVNNDEAGVPIVTCTLPSGGLDAVWPARRTEVLGAVARGGDDRVRLGAVPQPRVSVRFDGSRSL